jgi:hypothetical protein
MKMELWLVDPNPDLVKAWEVEFEGIPIVGRLPLTLKMRWSDSTRENC